MAAQKITSSQNKLAAYAESQSLDRKALPLIPTVGIERAYQIAMDCANVKANAMMCQPKQQ